MNLLVATFVLVNFEHIDKKFPGGETDDATYLEKGVVWVLKSTQVFPSYYCANLAFTVRDTNKALVIFRSRLDFATFGFLSSCKKVETCWLGWGLKRMQKTSWVARLQGIMIDQMPLFITYFASLWGIRSLFPLYDQRAYSALLRIYLGPPSFHKLWNVNLVFDG